MSMMARIRPDIIAMKGYSSARSLFKSADGLIYLDANECPFEPYIGAEKLARYPDQQPDDLMAALCRLYDVSSRNLIVTRGADEAIDVLIRASCEAGKDNIVICPPAFPMYDHSARLQGAEILEVPLKSDFSPDIAKIKKTANKNTKAIFLCSPNNPTANCLEQGDVEELCQAFDQKAFVVIDETYIDYAGIPSLIPLVDKYSNLVIMRTLSKSYAAAGLRCGVAIAQADVIEVMKKVLAPYPLPRPVIKEALTILKDKNLKRLATLRTETLKIREEFLGELKSIPGVEHIYPTQANFVLIKVDNADAFTDKCRTGGILVRNQSHQPGLKNCVRISIGSRDEMNTLISVMRGQGKAATKDQRKATIIRKTNETAIKVAVNLDADKPVKISTGVGFYDHMLEQIAKHGGFALAIECDGDLHIDPHHTIEDCAIALGTALKQALGDKRGICRYGFTLPMDEAQAQAVLDLSGRYFLDFKGEFPQPMVGDMPTDLVEHVFRSLAENLQANVHIEVKGDNTHHMVEACFKAFGRALRQAIKREGSSDTMPSSKGVL